MTAHLIPAGGEAPNVQMARRPFLPALGRLIAPFWRTRASRRAWLLLLLAIAGLVGEARLAYYSNAKFGDFTNAIVNKDMAALGSLAWVLLGVILIGVLLSVLGTYV